MRTMALAAVIEKAKKAVMVVPLYDFITSEYAPMMRYFDHIIDIGQSHKMVLRPATRLIEVDGVADYFCYYKQIRGCWILTKGLGAESERFAAQAKKMQWRNAEESTPRFTYYSKGIGPFECTTIDR